MLKYCCECLNRFEAFGHAKTCSVACAAARESKRRLRKLAEVATKKTTVPSRKKATS